MNRIIKFRAWDKKNKEMRIVIGMTFYDNGGGEFEVDSIAFDGMRGKQLQNWRVDQYSEPMQFTGLKDKNGKEIYEGDIVVDIAKIKTVVTWFEPHTGFTPFGGGIGERRSSECEVIGNIYENQDLLEKIEKGGQV